VAILGALRVTDDGGRPVEVGGARLRALLGRLALDPDRPVGVDTLVDDLWGGTPPADRLNALQSLVSRLRRLLPDGAVESGPAGYRLAVAGDAVDAVEFTRLADEGRQALRGRDPAAARICLSAALGLWRGRPLADVPAMPWAEAAADRLSERRLAATEDRIEAELALGGHATVLAELRQLAADHPLRERIRAQHVQALAAAGRQADALAEYEDVRRLLADELGVDPSPELREVQLRVLRAEDRPAPRSNLPAQLTSFVGRDGDLAAVADLLTAHRLVTLVGPGGAGKTRLSAEVAVRTLPRFPDGAWLAELAPVTGAEALPQAVLAAVNLPETRDPQVQADPMTRLVDLLGDRCALIVLDNCEHVIEAAARTAAELLARCPRLRILATSREPLGITGEALSPVAPLGLPPDRTTPADALRYPAVRLLADRVAAVRPGFAVDASTVGPAVEICRRLDGMPLAIELAAARTRALPVQEVAARLDDRFRLLTGGSRTALPRHQTLRAVVTWSWDLLTPAEAALADRLAVFPGGIAAAAAAEVCAGGPVDAEDVADLLAALVDKSLLQQVPGREPRYRMLETLREYGAERLTAAGDVVDVRRRHARHFLALAEEADSHLRRPEQLEWLARLTVERDNLLAALRFTTDSGDADTAIRLGAVLAWYWTARGEHVTASTWLATVAEMPGDAPEDARAVCAVVGAISSTTGGQGFDQLSDRMGRVLSQDLRQWLDHPLLGLLAPVAAMLSGREDEARSLLSAVDPTDPWSRATRHLLAALLAENEGDFTEHRDAVKRAYEGYRELGERWGLSTVLAMMGNLRLADGDPDGSVAAYAEAHQLMREITATEDASFTRTRMAAAYARAGDLARARSELTLARGEAEQLGSAIGLVSADLALAELAWQTGAAAEARTLAESAFAGSNHQSGGPPQLLAMVLSMLAVLDADDGVVDRARRRVVDAAGLPGADRDMPVMGAVALSGAYVELRARRPELAARMFGAALALRGTEDRGSPSVQRLREGLIEALGPAAFTREYDTGAASSREQALRLLLDNTAD
jgi:predicted ATPase/DNA-binding SARP family transcriptional activator